MCIRDSNKVKYLIGKVTMIHSVDSLRLAEEISKESVKKDAQTDILLEINCAGEESKFGIRPKDTLALVRQIAVLPNVHIRGLMTVAPLTQTPEENRVYFQLMKKLSVDIAQESVDNVSMDVLSMGMTIDYQTCLLYTSSRSDCHAGNRLFGLFQTVEAGMDRIPVRDCDPHSGSFFRKVGKRCGALARFGLF